MRHLSVWLMSVVSVGLACSGCRIGRISIGSHDHRPARVTHVYEVGKHVCTVECHEHYWDGTRLAILTTSHRHRLGCGHRWNGTYWVVVAKRTVARVHAGPRKVIKVKHVHGAACGCAYNRHGHKWIKVGKGHVHHRGCGHVYIEGRWSIRY